MLESDMSKHTDGLNFLKSACISSKCPGVAYFVILLCLTPNDFTHQEESAATKWVNGCMIQLYEKHKITFNVLSIP